MKEADFTYAVARVRANEPALLSAADIDQCIAAPSPTAAVEILRGKGYADIDAKLEETWSLLAEILPHPHALDFLIVKNDFHNLKAAVKCIFANAEPEAYFMRPCVYDAGEITQALQPKRFDLLPPCMAACAEEAYDLLAQTLDGQLADAVIDRQCLETTLALAEESGSDVAKEYAQLFCAFANIKTALRAARTHKGPDFLAKSLCPCASLDTNELAVACAQGIEGMAAYLAETPYSGAMEAYEVSGAAFEKYCDDALLACAAPAKPMIYGMEPLIAFYLAREAEVKTLRIVLSAKSNGAQPQEIRRRVRELYV